jgi:hypothetical protein
MTGEGMPNSSFGSRMPRSPSPFRKTNNNRSIKEEWALSIYYTGGRRFLQPIYRGRLPLIRNGGDA